MIRIYNYDEKKEILIDDSLSCVIVTPKMYLEPPHIIIEINGFFILNHMNTCDDCKSFVNYFGNEKSRWFLEYKNKKYLINNDFLGSNELTDNKIKQTISEYEYGTTLTLFLTELEIEKLNHLMLSHEQNEEYEKCIIFRDLIDEAKKKN